MFRACLSLSLVLVSATMATAQEGTTWSVGDQVLANFMKKGRWYPAVVVEVHEKRYRVVYQDGFTELRNSANTRPDSLREGSKIDALRDRKYTMAVVVKRLGNVARIQFPDGLKAVRGVGTIAIRTENLPKEVDGKPTTSANILAQWGKDTSVYYYGQIVEVDKDGRKLVIFEDGSKAWRTDGQIRSDLPRAGASVQVRLPLKTEFVPATLRTVIGGFAVRLDLPGKKKPVWTALSKLRVPAKQD